MSVLPLAEYFQCPHGFSWSLAFCIIALSKMRMLPTSFKTEVLLKSVLHCIEISGQELVMAFFSGVPWERSANRSESSGPADMSGKKGQCGSSSVESVISHSPAQS